MQEIARVRSAGGLIPAVAVTLAAAVAVTLAVTLAAAVAVAGCSDAGGPGASCGPTTCQGCCDTQGNCIVVASPAACGLGGASCAVCASGETCSSSGSCRSTVCRAASCPTGCCQGNQCVPGNTVNACGRGTGACAACSGGQACTTGVCVTVTRPCDARSCPAGCCYNGVCLPGDNPAACGKGGVVCAVCGSDEQCPAASKKCVTVPCGPGNCATGCCDIEGACLPGTSEVACGTGGAVCATCSSSQVCRAGSCQGVALTCTATSCQGGCCDSTGACVAGNTSAACGTGGAACAMCGSSQQCSNSACTCTAASCPTGCCDKNGCQPGTADALCGTGGAACKACDAAAGETCHQRACSKTCAWPGCLGCCTSSGACLSGNGPSACGANGAPCAQCQAVEACVGGTCNDSAACGATGSDKCASGCCKDGACQAGTSDLACGDLGDVCSSCAPQMGCDASLHVCRIRTDAKLDVILVSAEIDRSRACDSGLEGQAAPDVYVELTVGSQTRRSRTVDNDYNPVFNEYLMTAAASDLRGTIGLKVWDHDLFTADDLIAACQQSFYEDELESGSSIIFFPCSGVSDLRSISFRFGPAL